MPVIQLQIARDFSQIIRCDKITVVHFSIDWCKECREMNIVLNELSESYKDMQFITIAAATFPEITIEYEIRCVPTIIFFENQNAIDRIDGFDILKLKSICSRRSPETEKDENKQSLETRLNALINTAPLMIFIKGDRNQARCRFSKQLINIVNQTGLSYQTFDVLSDDEVRQGLKTFSDWPTFPQVYVKGALIGGLHKIKKLKAGNKLKKSLGGFN